VVSAADSPALVADPSGVDHVVAYGRFDGALAERAGPEVRRLQAIVADGAGTHADALAAALGHLGVDRGTVGLDESGLDPTVWQGLVERLADCKIVPAAGSLAEARRVKGPYEIECLDHALRIAEEALDVVIQVLDRGMTEREAAILYAGEVIRRGAFPHPAIVATGERTWIPAPWPTDRALRRGDLVRLDVGCIFKGYCGSVARTAVLGEPTSHMEASYLALRAALEAASAAVAPGVAAGRVFEAAIEGARSEGLPRYEPCHVGHGIGLGVRERPELAVAGAATLEPGEVLRVETPHCEVGSMGFSIGNTLLVTSAGSRALNRSRHDLIVLD